MVTSLVRSSLLVWGTILILRLPEIDLFFYSIVFRVRFLFVCFFFLVFFSHSFCLPVACSTARATLLRITRTQRSWRPANSFFQDHLCVHRAACDFLVGRELKNSLGARARCPFVCVSSRSVQPSCAISPLIVQNARGHYSSFEFVASCPRALRCLSVLGI